jgi:transposase
VSYIEGVDRQQGWLLPERLEDYVSADNPVRFLDAFVESLNLAVLGFQRAQPQPTGRPPYQPGDLLRLYLYGYLNRLRSSRRLEREAQRNVELLWLLRQLRPDFKTIADFRKDNLQSLRAVCREFTLLCRKLELFGGELVAIDGSKFRALNSKRRNYSATKLRATLAEIDAKIDGYLQQLDAADAVEPDTPRPSAAQLQAKINQLQQRRQQSAQRLEHLQSSGQTQVSLTDPDSRSMKVGQSTEVCYNVQTAVDAKHKLIVAHQVTNAVTDLGQLTPLAVQAKQTLGVAKLEAVADMGYYWGAQVKECAEAGITAYIPKALTSANTQQGLFGKERFRYDAGQDCYRCPAGQELSYRSSSFELGRAIRYYRAPLSACRACALKARCTRNKEARRISRWEHEGLLEQMQQRVAAQPEKMARRKALAEHPFGTIKRGMDAGYFLLRGLEKVRAEMSLTVLAYNLKRVLNILGVPKLIVAVS